MLDSRVLRFRARRGPSGSGHSTVGQLLKTLRGAGQPGPYFVIPVAGHVTGARGEEFRTDLTVWAGDGLEHTIAVAWLAQGRDNGADELHRFVIGQGACPPSFPISLPRISGRQGSGRWSSLAGIDANRASLAGGVRAEVEIATSGGGDCPATGSMPYTAVHPGAPARVAAGGLRLGGGYRTNVGIVNVDREPHTWTVSYASTDGSFAGAFPVRLAPLSSSNTGLPPAFDGPVIVSIESDGTGADWAAWAASVNDASGDGWYVPANPY